MLDQLADFAQLETSELLICLTAVFLAGLVRGFSGFALSALVMASIVIILPPVDLIPICYILEGVASILMFRGGLRDADMTIVWGLTIGSIIGVPIGLHFTVTFPVETTKLIALLVVLALAVAQLMKFRPTFLATRSGLYGSGVVSGIVTGLASVGGMVVALYVLASEAPARTIRASLVMYLLLTMFTSIVYLLMYGVMNQIALIRGAILTPPLIIGVLLGCWIFRPSLEKFYRQFCLSLLILLACIGLLRLSLG